MPPGHVLAGADEGTWALVGALALRLGNPAVMVRRTPKTYFVSYGDDPNVGDGRLAGERLAGTQSTWWMTWCTPGRRCPLPWTLASSRSPLHHRFGDPVDSTSGGIESRAGSVRSPTGDLLGEPVRHARVGV